MGKEGILRLAQGADSIMSGVMDYNAETSDATFRRAQAELNASMLDLQAESTIQQASDQASLIRRGALDLLGKQTTALAAGGVEGVTAQAILGQTLEGGLVDEETMKSNALRKAFGYQMEAMDKRYQGKMDEIKGKARGRAGLLGGFTQGLNYLSQISVGG
jgi:hypothetical protein